MENENFRVKLHDLLLVGVASLPLFAFSTQEAKSGDNLWFILDSSGSMAGKVEGSAKLDIAKKALPELFAKAPATSKINLLAYGHRKKDDCKDIDIIATGTSANKAIFDEKIKSLKPLGKTPMATSLLLTGELIKKTASDDNNSIVLISDGIETCEGDPCAVAEKLASANTKIKTHVVGFKIPEKDKKQLECIAKKGGGQYFAANSTEGFAKAVAAAAKKPEKPKPPQFEEVFRDDFDGDELMEHWEIVNPNPDRFIVEDGKLLVVGKIPAKLDKPDKINQENFFKLNKELPKGDWIFSAKMSVRFQTIHELPRLGIIDKPDKHISARIHTHKGTWTWLNLQVLKQSGSQLTHFNKEFGTQVPHKEVIKHVGDSFELQLVKQGRKYFSRYRPYTDEEKKKPWIVTGEVTQLRAKGTPFLSFSQVKDEGGESEFFVDWVKIETPKKETPAAPAEDKSEDKNKSDS